MLYPLNVAQYHPTPTQHPEAKPATEQKANR